MYLLALQAAAEGGGQIEQIARTFGVDWPHLIAQIVSFGIVCARAVQRFAYKPILKMLEARRQQIAEGLANAEKIKAELARIEAERQDVLAKAGAEGKQLIEEARAAAARVQAEETQKAIAAAEQIIGSAREATERDRARMLADLKQRGRTAGRADDGDGHRQDPDAGRSAAPGRGDGEAAGARSSEHGSKTRSEDRNKKVQARGAASCSGCASSTAAGRGARAAGRAAARQVRTSRRASAILVGLPAAGAARSRPAHGARRERHAARRRPCGQTSWPASRASTARGSNVRSRESGADRRHAHQGGQRCVRRQHPGAAGRAARARL